MGEAEEEDARILDISSSDDTNEDDDNDDFTTTGFSDSTLTSENFDWVNDLLKDSPSYDAVFDNFNINNDEEEEGEDSDDVVVVGEVIVSKIKKKKKDYNCAPPIDDDDGDSDDDCVILECDPDDEKKGVKTKKGEKGDFDKSFNNDNDEDDDDGDLVVVGESGQVACRDYPHSRHLCAKHPFNSTPPEIHCNLCHCYVCDSLAPCTYWVSGDSGVGHCHATDKAVFWQGERKKARESKNPPDPSKDSGPTVPLPIPQLQQTTRRVDPLSRPLSSCGVSSPYGSQSIISQGQDRCQRLSSPVTRNSFQPHLVSHQLLKACNKGSDPNLVYSRPIFKRAGTRGRSGLSYRSVHGSANNFRGSLLQQRVPPLVAGRQTVNNPSNVIGPSPYYPTSTISPQFRSVARRGYSSPVQGYSPSAHQASHMQGYNRYVPDSAYVHHSRDQTQNFPYPVIPSNSPSPLNTVMQNKPQHSAVTVAQRVSASYLPSNPPSGMRSCQQFSAASDVAAPVLPNYGSVRALTNQQCSGAMENLSGPANPCGLPGSILNSSHEPLEATNVQSGLNSHRGTSNLSANLSGSIHQASEALNTLSGVDVSSHTADEATNTLCGGPSKNGNKIRIKLRTVKDCVQQPVAENSLGYGDVPSSAEHSQQLFASINPASPNFDIERFLHNEDPYVAQQDETFMFNMENGNPLSAPMDTGMLYFDFETSWKGLAHS